MWAKLNAGDGLGIQLTPQIRLAFAYRLLDGSSPARVRPFFYLRARETRANARALPMEIKRGHL